jgi:hypothetical protein
MSRLVVCFFCLLFYRLLAAFAVLDTRQDYMDGCGDSLDLVPIAAWLGKGKRKGHYGAYLLACFDEDDDQ